MAAARLLPPVAAPPEPTASARAAGLRHVTDAAPGIRRRRAGRGFAYLGPDGKPVKDAATLARIRRLAIPPAWTEVWICLDPLGHLQATGRDARGRKQYRYHPRWRQTRDGTKYARMGAFGRALPAIRRRVARDLALPGLPREKVLATLVRLLESTLMRVGNEEYARQNGSYGLTTLRDRHVEVEGPRMRFRFRGKGGKTHEMDVEDPRLARVVKRCQDLPGQELFQYVDAEGVPHAVASQDVNDYLRGITGQDFTAKDFRTWAGTVLAAVTLREMERAPTRTRARRNVVRAVERVAERLGNTPAICRKSYVHPRVLDGYLDGTLVASLRRHAHGQRPRPRGLDADEAAVLALLERRPSPEDEARARSPEPRLRKPVRRARKERARAQRREGPTRPA